MKPFVLPYAGLIVVAGAVGCTQTSFSQSIWNPFNDLELNFDITKKPVRIGMVAPHSGPLALENWLPVRKAPPYAGLRDQISRHLGCGVQIQELEPFQIVAHLQSGRIQYALVSEEAYKTMTAYGPPGELLASAIPLTRKGLIVTSAKSSLQSLADIKGKRFAFGPKDDAVLATGALKTLEAAGVTKDDIPKELLPIIPNVDRLQYHISSYEAAKEIVYGIGTEAGVIEASEYESFPDTGGRLLPLRFAKDDFRVLGETETVRLETGVAGPFLASPEAHPEITQQVREFLSKAHLENRNALEELGLARFEVVAVQGEPKQAVAHSTEQSDSGVGGRE